MSLKLRFMNCRTDQELWELLRVIKENARAAKSVIPRQHDGR